MNRREFLKATAATLAMPSMALAEQEQQPVMVCNPAPFVPRCAVSYKLIDGRFRLVPNESIRAGDKLFMIGLDEDTGELWRILYGEAASDFKWFPQDTYDNGGFEVSRSFDWLNAGCVGSYRGVAQLPNLRGFENGQMISFPSETIIIFSNTPAIVEPIFSEKKECGIFVPRMEYAKVFSRHENTFMMVPVAAPKERFVLAIADDILEKILYVREDGGCVVILDAGIATKDFE